MREEVSTRAMRRWPRWRWPLAHVLLAIWWLIAPVPGWRPCRSGVYAQSPAPLRRVNASHFAGDIPFDEMAVFWFGQVDSISNYADVRIGYNDDHLYIHVAIFDRYLWYDTTPSPSDLAEWDAVTLYLDLNHDGGAPSSDDYRFVGQLVWWEDRDAYQAVYRGDGSGWVLATVPFTTTSGWRGNAPNDDEDDRGWVLGICIPFEGLGLSGPPPQGTVWGMAVVVHDRDDADGTPVADRVWPEAMSPDQPGTWGDLHFGLPDYAPPPAVTGGVVAIRHRLDGATVPDATVGGTIGNLCPGDPDVIWNQWGDANFAGALDFNLQNQADVADWPCFAKYYITFPLDAVPPGKAVISASLALHQWGGSDPTQARPSLIQVFTVADDWDEATLTWNNAPLAAENVARTWVAPLPSSPDWPGVPRVWDVSGAAAEAYALGAPFAWPFMKPTQHITAASTSSRQMLTTGTLRGAPRCGCVGGTW